MADTEQNKIRQLEQENAKLKEKLDRVIRETESLEGNIAFLMKRHQAEAEAKTLQMANFAHEFRNPLNVIIGYSDLLKSLDKKSFAQSRYKDYCTAIHDAAQLLLGVASSIIDQASQENAPLPVLTEEFDASEVIDSVIRMLGEEAKKRDITLLGSYAPDFPALNTDKGKFQQILMNLVSNAIKFTNRGGKVTVETATSDNGEDFILVVTDNGSGMDEEEIGKVLKPWGRLDSHIEQQEGAGLGLPIVVQLAELLGWRFTLESKKGKGTTARLCIPSSGNRPAKPSIKSWGDN